MDVAAEHSRRADLQYRRLPDALDERRVRLNAASRGQSGGRERYAVAFFLDPNPDAVVACLPSCMSTDVPAKYPATTRAAYLKQRLEAADLHGAKP